MRYPYECKTCHFEFDVIKSYKDIDILEPCEKCGGETRRLVIGGTGFYGEKDWDNPRFEPSLGCMVKNRSEMKRIVKSRGLEEVGNTSPETMHKMHKQEQENKRQKAYDQAEVEALKMAGEMTA